MNLNEKTSDLKLYSRLKYFNGLPLTSEDLHQEDDLLYRKVDLILKNTLGSGALEDPRYNLKVSESSKLLSIKDPFTVNLEGDIFLVGNSADVYPLSIEDTFSGTLLLVCWFKEISNNVLYEYGGLCNKQLENDLVDDNLKIITSNRYQIRWNLTKSSTILDYNNPTIKPITILDQFATEAGYSIPRTIPTTNMSIVGKFYKIPESPKVPSSNGFVYILPIANVISGVLSLIDVPKNVELVKSPVEPSTELSYIWYNTLTEEFFINIDGIWKPISVNNQEYTSVGSHVFTESILIPKDVEVNIPTSLGNKSLKLLYNGIELTNNVDYEIDRIENSIILLQFTVIANDVVSFLVS